MFCIFKKSLIFFIFSTCSFFCSGVLLKLNTDKFVHQETLDVVVGSLMPGAPFWDHLRESKEACATSDPDNFCLGILHDWAYSSAVESSPEAEPLFESEPYTCLPGPIAELKANVRSLLVLSPEITAPQLPRYLRKLNMQALDQVVKREIKEVLQAIIIFDKRSRLYCKLEGAAILRQKRGGEFESAGYRDPSWA